MKKTLLSGLCSLIFLVSFSGFSQCDATDQCNYAFLLTDTFGDGWNGNTMTVSQNGNVVAVLELPQGYTATQYVPLCNNVPFELYWNAGGVFNFEVGVAVVNPFGQTIYALQPNTTNSGTVLANATVNCFSAVCVAPVNVFFDGMINDSAVFSWVDAGNTALSEYLVLPAGLPAPDASASGTTTAATTVSLDNLSPNDYNFYVRTICLDGLTSDWSTPTYFSTVCTIPNGVFLNATTGTSFTANWQETGFATQWEVIVQPVTDPFPTAATAGTLVTSTPYEASALNPGTVYYFFVRSICSDSSSSDWTTPMTFTAICDIPTQIAISEADSSSATFSWATPGASQWEVIVQLASDAAPNTASPGIVANVNSYQATGLAVDTNYIFYVRAVCGPGATSEWSWPQPFTLYQSLPPLTANTTQFTPSQLISEVLVNSPCIEITNVTSSTGNNFGSLNNGIGYFTNANPTFPIASGLVLSTGDAMHVPGPNTTTLSDGSGNIWPGDIDLEAIILAATGLPMNSHNATKLEFDFTTPHEFMSFNFLFASDEYGVFQCNFADAFAFLLTDLESGITTNIAVVPGTNVPVSVVTIRDEINNTSCQSMNPGFFGLYSDPQTGAAYSAATNFNGQTALMTASSAIIPNHPYHIKLVVADRQDEIFDSAVFIEAGSFTAGPPQCTDKIQLVAFIDTNDNGVKDSGEVNFTYGSFTSQQNNAGDLTSITSPFGTYTVYDSNPANSYDFGYAVNAEYAGYYSASGTFFDNVTITVGSGTQLLYFPIVLTQAYNDVTVSILPVTPPVPGSLNFVNKIVYKNLGVSNASGTITFTKDPSTTIINVSQPGTVATANGFSFDYASLAPYETRTVTVTMSIPEIPVVNIDDLLTDGATISASNGETADIDLSNNAATNSQVVVASYDPNDKMESHGEKIQFSHFAQDDYLFYTIRFQNTGTSNAISVRLEDLLDAQIDPESIRVVSASHNYVMERVDNKVVWHFDYIQLPPALQDEALSKGYVTFKVQLKPGFAVGDIIPNTADIYFDSNPAITTNTFNTEFVELLANVGFDAGNLLLFPNPANNVVQVSLQNTNEVLDAVTLYDVLGKTVKKVTGISANQANLDVSALSNGVYIVEIHTENDVVQIRKLVIQ